MKKKNLFEEASIGSLTLQNHFFRSACGDSHGIKGHITQKDIDLYNELAGDKIGAIITGYTWVSDYGMGENIGMFGIYDDSFIDEYRKLTDSVHEKNGRIILQLVHLGSGTLMKNVKILAPSIIENSMTKTVPEEMTLKEIKRIEEDFLKAAIRANKAGFDGIELHGAHNFLINQFISPHYNHRTDNYGGSVENRARFVTEILKSIRNELGKDFPVLIKVQSKENFNNSFTDKEFLLTCKFFEETGASAIEVSGPWMDYKQKTPYFEDIASMLADSVNIPVILTGGIRDIETAERILNETNIKFIGMCRPFINNPKILTEWESGESKSSKCISCGGCSRTHTCILTKK